jgi:hypothetical protein
VTRTRLGALAAVLLFCTTAAYAHRIDEYLQATLLSLDATGAHASMRLIPGTQVADTVIATIDSNHDGAFSYAEKLAYAQRVLRDLFVSVDGVPATPQLRSYTIPDPAQLHDGLGEIHIDYDIALAPGGPHRALVIENHHRNTGSVYLVNATVPDDPGLRITAQKRNPSQSVYELDFDQAGAVASGSMLSRWNGAQFVSLFHLGIRHIAEGTDHLLFLLVLLLPAPLLAFAGRWAGPASVRHSLLHILGIVTAFTIGHSITLMLSAANIVHVPESPIEVLIAVSILVSAIHALRPIFPGRESLIAAFFGLIHGLAFAATLSRLGLTHWQRIAGILAFNLGIETMQLAVVAAVLPSLLLLSRTRAYSIFRIGGALFATAASIGWIIDRTTPLTTHVDTVMNTLANHAIVFAVALLLISLACRFIEPTAARLPVD